MKSYNQYLALLRFEKIFLTVKMVISKVLGRPPVKKPKNSRVWHFQDHPEKKSAIHTLIAWAARQMLLMATKVLQNLPFIGGLLLKPRDDQSGLECVQLMDEFGKLDAEEIIELGSIDRCNKLLTELTVNLNDKLDLLTSMYYISRNSEASKIMDFDDNMVICAIFLHPREQNDDEEDDFDCDREALMLFEKDKNAQLALIKAQKTIMEARRQMDTLDIVLDKLCCSKLPLPEELINKAEGKLKEAGKKLMKPKNFFDSYMDSHCGPPDALLSRMIALSPGWEEYLEMSFSYLRNNETTELFKRAHLRHLEQQD